MKTIGELIEKEVRNQEFNIVKFANAISCKRTNVYNIFKRTNIDIILLARISNVLKHNFFADLANDSELIPSTETTIDDAESANNKAVSQFLNVMPEILEKLGMENIINFCKYVEKEGDVIATPDMTLPSYHICFTIGEHWIERAKISEMDKLLEIKTVVSDTGIRVDLIHNILYGSTFIDIKLDYKTKQEWEDTIKYVRDEILMLNN
ncbi:MAG: hypothetical protein IJP50_04920 [Paludibacteraceae bacterium]|nr:hypothetical protein [Paludibacteraceae bacterium]